MPKLLLTPEEDVLKTRLEDCLKRLDSWRQMNHSDVETLMAELGKVGLELHTALKSRALEPHHAQRILDARKITPTSGVFYEDVTACQSLLAFVDGVSLSPLAPSPAIMQQTISVSSTSAPASQTATRVNYDFKVYSRKTGQFETWKLCPTDTGWDFTYLANRGNCEKTAAPFLYEALRHHQIRYPETLPDYFAHLWAQTEKLSLGQTEIQAEIEKLAKWVSITERGTPGGIFESIKISATTDN